MTSRQQRSHLNFLFCFHCHRSTDLGLSSPTVSPDLKAGSENYFEAINPLLMHNIHLILHITMCPEELGKFYTLCIELCITGSVTWKSFPLYFQQVVAHYCHRVKALEMLCTRQSPHTHWELWIIYLFKSQPANPGEKWNITFLTEGKNTWTIESKSGKHYLPWWTG